MSLDRKRIEHYANLPSPVVNGEQATVFMYEIREMARMLLNIPGKIHIDQVVDKVSVQYSLSNTGATGFRDGWNAHLKESGL